MVHGESDRAWPQGDVDRQREPVSEELQDLRAINLHWHDPGTRPCADSASQTQPLDF